MKKIKGEKVDKFQLFLLFTFKLSYFLRLNMRFNKP